jgi:hypothetical protein
MAGWGLIQNNTVPNALQVGTVTILSKHACELQTTQLAGRQILGDEKTLCSIAYPYILSRPVSHLYILFYTYIY